MKTFGRRTLSVILSVIMVLSCFAGMTFSVGAETSGDYEYEVLEDGTVSLTDYNGSDTDIIIPSEIDGRNVTKIEYLFHYNRELISVTIPDSVTEIGRWAFEGCTGLTSITIPDSVTTIGDSAFEGCTGLTSVTIPDSVTTIGDSAFDGCTGLTSVTISNSVTEIDYGLFYGCTGLTSVTIPDSVTTIGHFAFYKCTGLTSVTIPDSVTEIGSDAFYGCSGLTSITIPDSVTTIGNSAFSGCTGLTSITIPDSVTTIGSDAFYGCSGLKEIIVDENNENYISVDDVLFNKDMTKLILYPACKEGEYVVPDSVTTIENHAFSGCSGLTSITIPDSVTEIGSGAFYGCSGLKEIIVGENNENYISVDDVLFNKDMTKLILYPACKEGEYVIPDSVTEEIGYGVFSGCTGLTSVTIPDSVTTIGNSAFSGCTGLTSVTIPDSVTTIGHLAFYKCTGLTSITIPDSVTTIEWGLFFGCTGLTSVTIGGGVTKIDDSAFEGCSGLKEINVNENNEIYKSVDGVLFNKDMTVLLTCPSGKEGSYIIPDSVVVIMFDAFDGCTVLESVTIGKGVKYTSVYDESESEYYYDFYTKYNVFKSCTSLKEITVDEENEYYKSVDGVLFNKNMRSLITYPVGKEGAYVVPDSVIQIEMCAFYGCTGLTSIEITKNVYHILPGAFIGCKNLKNVVINKCEVVLDDEGDIVDELAFYIVINSNAFSGCENLEEIKICRFVVEFGDDVFDFDDAESVDFTIYGYVNSIEADYSVKEYASKHSLNFVELQCEHENMVTDEQEPTCTEWGIKGRKACYECGFYDEGEQIPPLGHSIENYVSNNDATCTKDGTKTAKCERCGETQIITDVGSAKGHTAVKDGAVEPTCTKTGLTEGSHCSKCGATVEKQEIIPALGHVDSDNDGICDVCARSTSSNDDCDTAGHIDSDKDGICDSCGDTMPEVKNCKCICHKSGFAGFIYKIIRFLWKIFRMNKSCDCGLAHY